MAYRSTGHGSATAKSAGEEPSSFGCRRRRPPGEQGIFRLQRGDRQGVTAGARQHGVLAATGLHDDANGLSRSIGARRARNHWKPAGGAHRSAGPGHQGDASPTNAASRTKASRSDVVGRTSAPAVRAATAQENQPGAEDQRAPGFTTDHEAGRSEHQGACDGDGDLKILVSAEGQGLPAETMLHEGEELQRQEGNENSQAWDAGDESHPLCSGQVMPRGECPVKLTPHLICSAIVMIPDGGAKELR